MNLQIQFSKASPVDGSNSAEIHPRSLNVIVSTTRINVAPENRRELFQTILPLLDPIRNESGCVAYRCYVELTDENSAMLISEWEEQTDWENYLSSTDCAILLGALNALATPANIDFKLLGKIG